MKMLLLMRHAKSSWDHASRTDYDRPLNERGKKDAPRMGHWIAEKEIFIQHVVTSAARRARKTAKRVARTIDYTGTIEERRDLYMASPAAWMTMLHALPDEADTVLCVGHNPTMELLVEHLGRTRHAMPTAAIACFTLDDTTWGGLHPGPQLVLQTIWTPGHLED